LEVHHKPDIRSSIAAATTSGAAWCAASTQELKTTDAEFPAAAIRSAGYEAVWKGQKSWNCVAILGRGAAPIVTRTELPSDPADAQSRYIEAAVSGLLVASFRSHVKQKSGHALQLFTGRLSREVGVQTRAIRAHINECRGCSCSPIKVSRFNERAPQFPDRNKRFLCPSPKNI